MQKKAIIVTDNLAGFITAQTLHHKGYDVTLVDTDQEPRSAARFQNLGLPFYRNTSLFRHGLRELADALGIVVDVRELELPPQTVSNHETRPFIGFGDSKAPALQPLSHYNHAGRLTLSKSEREIVRAFLAKDDFKYLPVSELTAINLDGSTVAAITLAGGQTLSADYYLFMTNQTPWLSLLPIEMLGSRTRARLAKAKVWSRILVELSHPSAPRAEENVFILLPNQADHNPCAGAFYLDSTATGATFKSVWETYISADRLEDTEYVAGEIRALRKIVKKAFVGVDETSSGALSITPTAFSDAHWVNTQKDIHEIAKNLLIYPALAADSLGFAQSVECASWALDGLAARVEARAERSHQPEDHAPSLL